MINTATTKTSADDSAADGCHVSIPLDFPYRYHL